MDFKNVVVKVVCWKCELQIDESEILCNANVDLAKKNNNEVLRIYAKKNSGALDCSAR
ncbi:hypothetical protein [Chryseobacterium sp. FH1]|uniref:hypothetical protein n=1 Tax=Chryseobacterium sp. FH1 TaxID=1233951 RepID=UPI000B115D9C|nr:hypothetical protein [Chryseobacterium sp. FH1]